MKKALTGYAWATAEVALASVLIPVILILALAWIHLGMFVGYWLAGDWGGIILGAVWIPVSFKIMADLGLI